MHKKAGLIVVLCILLLDQVSKYYLIGLVQGGEVELLPFFKLVMWWNTGVSFGMFSEHNMPWVLIALALAISGILLRWLWKEDKRHVALAIGLVVGGALGNVIDRVRFGAVADFFYFYWGDYYWPAFNIADSAICIGVAILIWDSIVPSKS